MISVLCTNGSVAVTEKAVEAHLVLPSRLLTDVASACSSVAHEACIDLRCLGALDATVKDFLLWGLHLKREETLCQEQGRRYRPDPSRALKLSWDRLVDVVDLALRLDVRDEWWQSMHETAWRTTGSSGPCVMLLPREGDRCSVETLARLLDLARIAPWLCDTKLFERAVCCHCATTARQDIGAEARARLQELACLAMRACVDAYREKSIFVSAFTLTFLSHKLGELSDDDGAFVVRRLLEERKLPDHRGFSELIDDCLGFVDAALEACLRGGQVDAAGELLRELKPATKLRLPRAAMAFLRLAEAGRADAVAHFGADALLSIALRQADALLARRVMPHLRAVPAFLAQLSPEWVCRQLVDPDVSAAAVAVLLLEADVPAKTWLDALDSSKVSGLGWRMRDIDARGTEVLRALFDAPSLAAHRWRIANAIVGLVAPIKASMVPQLGDYPDEHGAVAKLLEHVVRAAAPSDLDLVLRLSSCAFRLRSAHLAASAGELAAKLLLEHA